MIFYNLFRWCTVVSTFLFYKAVDTIIINICRILLCIFHFTGRKLSKLFFCFHCLNWLVYEKIDIFLIIFLIVSYCFNNFSGYIYMYYLYQN